MATTTRVSDTPIIDRLCTRASQIEETDPDCKLLMDAAESVRDLLTTLQALLFACRDGAVLPRDSIHAQTLAVIAKTTR